MKSLLNVTQGVVRVTGSETQGLDRVFDVSGIKKALFVVRTYNAGTFGTLHLESSNQKTDATNTLWQSIGSATIAAGSDANNLFKILGDEDELFSFLRWRFVTTSGTDGTTFEITGYGLD
jgi:hypothetical protein